MKALRSFLTVLVLGALMALTVERFAGSPAAATPPDPRLVAMLAMGGCPGCPGDLNGDNVVNSADLSVLLANFGNVCQPDSDGDGIPNNQDNCPNTPNPTQSDLDADNVGDVCDNCPTQTNPGQEDADNDSIGDACEGNFCQTAAQCPQGPPNTTPICSGNQCQYVCSPGYADCNSIQADGCEVYVLGDSNNCSGCGIVCPANHVCVNGQCVFQCPPGFTNCSGQCKNLLTDSQNCGACGLVCAFPNAVAACVNGQCTITSCMTGFANCNNINADGCEVNISNNNSHCGGCGMVCPTIANGVNLCLGGQCVPVCNTGFANCNAINADGCEVNLNTNTSHCGNCNVVCTPGPHVTSVTCTNGVCQITGCQTGWQNQNGIFSDGCEFQVGPPPG